MIIIIAGRPAADVWRPSQTNAVLHCLNSCCKLSHKHTLQTFLQSFLQTFLQTFLQPLQVKDYGQASYWDRRYEEEVGLKKFEWYQSYDSLQPILERHLGQHGRVLQVSTALNCTRGRDSAAAAAAAAVAAVMAISAEALGAAWKGAAGANNISLRKSSSSSSSSSSGSSSPSW
jgi:hypothetical protein